MNELDLIDKLRPLAGPAGLQLMDDAALLDLADGQQLVISTDTMVEGVHFPAGKIGGGFSERLLRTALSDLAAKGARPIGYSLNVSWPAGRDARWLDGFVIGLRDGQSAFDCPLIGGDTTGGTDRLVASATVYGVVPKGRMITRSGAKVGDIAFHTGELGLAEIGLAVVTGQSVTVDAATRHRAEEAYLRPEPRFVFRKVLRDYATACADISDGIVSEAGHIAAASGVAIDLLSKVTEGADFGDDYELLFCIAPEDEAAMRDAAASIGISVTEAGRAQAGQGITIDGKPASPKGYRHEL